MIDRFLDYLKVERNRSESTIVEYGRALNQFLTFLESLNEEGLTWATVDESVVREWMFYMVENKHSKPATLCWKLSALRSFYRYLMRIGVATRNPAKRVMPPKKPKLLPVFIHAKDMDKLLDILVKDKSYEGILKNVIIAIFYLTGMRRAEILGLRDSDFDFYAKNVKVTGKGDKQRLIPFGAELELRVREYMQARWERYGQRFKVFLIDEKGQPMSKTKIGRIVKNCLSLVSTAQKRSPHVLRHTFATALINNDADLVSIQKLLGHSTLTTTEIYTHLSFEELKRIYNKAHPHS